MTVTMRGTAILISAVLLLAGCGGGDGGGLPGSTRPSAEDIATSIKGGASGIGVGPDMADCAASLVVDSQMSDQAIGRYLEPDHPLYVDGDDYAFTAEDSQAFDDFVAALKSECGYVQPGG